MVEQLIYLICYGITMAGFGLFIGYRWGTQDGRRKEWERWKRLKDIDNRNAR